MKSEEIKEHFNRIAGDYDYWKKKNNYYYSQLKNFYASVIPKGKDVLEVGCGTGDILNSVSPRIGVGVDVSENMVEIAKSKHPNLSFVAGSMEGLSFEEKFDYVIMADVIEHLSDIWAVLGALKKVLKENGEVVITIINPVWRPLLFLAEKIRLKMPEGPINFVFSADIANLAELLGFRIKEKGRPFLKNLCLTQHLVLKAGKEEVKKKDLSCSIIVPCHNEAGNLERCVRRIPKIGRLTEIIVVDDGSTDETKRIAEKLSEEMGIKLIAYFPKRGKGFAVKTGFRAAAGDVLIILDADMSVDPEELPRFFIPLNEGRAQFVNGTRMIYPPSKQAMSCLHLCGNKVFSFILSWLMHQRITDSLCGTKVLLREDFHKKIRMEHCPWGDFDLLFGSTKANLKIVEMPVHYKRRESGQSKMKTFKHGFLLLCMCFRGFVELKLMKLAIWRR